MNISQLDILAKPSGITLEQHTSDVVSEVLSVCDKISTTCEKYEGLVHKNLRKRLEVAALFHDVGKSTKKWQLACQADYLAYRKWKQTHIGGNFKDFSSVCPVDAGKNLRFCGVRHEGESLRMKMRKIPLPVSAAIGAHHAKLGKTFKERWILEGHKDIWNQFERASNDVIEGEKLKQIAIKVYEYDGVRGLLQQADHRASAKEDGEVVPAISSFSYIFPFPEKRGIQKMVEEHWQEELLLVRAPTGAGKTDACLLWASKQIENHRAERLVIAMPTRFTSNALAISVSETLSETGLYHSSSWFAKYNDEVKNGVSSLSYALKELDMARSLLMPITVCTIDHLLMSLTMTREDHHLTNFNLANSCLVIDEADFYDDFTQANINFMLTVLRYWNVPTMVMSASLPEAVLKVYQGLDYQVSNILEDRNDNDRVRFSIETIVTYDDFSDIDEIIEKAIDIGNAIFYMNTVDKAVCLYRYVSSKMANTDSVLPIILYHSRFTEPDKMRKENELLHTLGKEAWKEGTAGGIAILTQIGEMSINISADIMVSDVCPIDRLTQRAGRLCRFDETKIGRLYILCPQKDGILYPAPYGSYNRKERQWIPCPALSKTMEKLTVGNYSVTSLIDMLNEVYTENQPLSAKAISNANMLRSYFTYNWLIRSREQTPKDGTVTNFWSSRDIAAQSSVFVEEPYCLQFYNYSSFYEYKLEKAIELPVYLIEKGRKLHRIDSKIINIGESHTESIDVLREGFYLNDIGINLMEEEGDNFLW